MNNKWMLAALLLAAACSPREAIPEAPDYASAESWYVTDRGADVDLFYISSTETFDATVGRKVFHYAQAADSAACPGMRGEMEPELLFALLSADVDGNLSGYGLDRQPLPAGDG